MKPFTTFLILSMLFSTGLFSFCTAQIQWTSYTGNPVLRPGPSGNWDDVNVLATSVVQVNDTLHMWYDGNHYSGNFGGIGHAWSLDGRIWIKDTLNNPVLTEGPSLWDAGWVSFVSVLINPADSLFHMWYSGRGDPNTYHPIYIGHATSPDGSSWTKDSNPVLSPGPPGSWDDDALIHPCVVLVNDTIHMWYDGFRFGFDYSRIGHAISTDWLSWKKDAENPVLTRGSKQNWDYPLLRASQVFHDGWRFNMFYIGGVHPNYDIGYAYSDGGTNWIKYPDPVMVRGNKGSWDIGGLFTGSVLLNAGRDSLKMWYSGISGGTSTGKIGYAMAPVSYEAIFEYRQQVSSRYQFTDNSVGIITDWFWNFGDSNTSSERNPVHSYAHTGTYTITLTIKGLCGSDSTSKTIDVVVGLEEKEDNIPKRSSLSQNYPNPFNPTTNINYELQMTNYVNLSIYNLLGQKIVTLVNRKQKAGPHQIEWNATGFSSGLYYYILRAGDFQDARKMLLLR